MAFPALGLQKRLLQIPYIKMRTRVAVELVQKKKLRKTIDGQEREVARNCLRSRGLFKISSIAQRIYVLLQFLNRELIHCGLAHSAIHSPNHFLRVETKRENLHKMLELGQFENSTFLSAHPFHAS